jgi:hypothetical protein
MSQRLHSKAWNDSAASLCGTLTKGRLRRHLGELLGTLEKGRNTETVGCQLLQACSTRMVVTPQVEGMTATRTGDRDTWSTPSNAILRSIAYFAGTMPVSNRVGY